MKKNHYTLFLAIGLWLMADSCFGQVTFNYTGAVQTYTVPPCVYQLIVDVRGAQGNGNSNNDLIAGNNGARVQGTIQVTPGQILDIFVGGGGAINDTGGGWNGGGGGGLSYQDWPAWQPSPLCPTAHGAGGGGASDIRSTPYGLANRIVVAGGGGGTGGDRIQGCGPGAGGGGGGGYYGGGGGGGYSGLPGTGGTQAVGGTGGLSPGCAIYGGLAGYNGALGVGGLGGGAPGNNQFGSAPGCMGGAGGTLIGATGFNCTGGGCPGTWSGGSGGGGSDYVSCIANVTQTQGYQIGNGEVIVTPTGPCTGFTITVTQINPLCNQCNGSADVSVSGGTSPYTYSWAPGGQTTAAITGLCGGTYTITVTDLCHNTITASIILPSNSLLITQSVTANERCFGDCIGEASVSVSGGTPPFIYNWTPSGGTTTVASSLCAGIYTITVQDNAGCIGTASVDITQPALLAAFIAATNLTCYEVNQGAVTASGSGGTLPYTYQWNGGPQSSNPTESNLSAGTYNLNLTDANGCIATAFITLTQPTQLTVSLTGPPVICVGQSGKLTATGAGGTSPYNYAWSWINGGAGFGSSIVVSPVANTTYSVIVTDANGCSLTSSITVDLGPPLIVTVSGPKSTCSGNSVILCGNATGGVGFDTYTWQPGNLSGNCVSVAPTVSTTYSLFVQDQCGGDTTVTVFVFVNPLPDVALTADVQQGCSPLCVQFQDLSAITTGKVTSWSWKFGNRDSSRKENPDYCYLKPGNFTINLTAVSDSGCSSSLITPNMINVFSHPAALFNSAPQPTTILSPDIQFTDKSMDIYGLAYWFWNFGDNINTMNNVSNMENPSHTYSDTGTYCPRLVVMNMHGCTDTTTNCLVIDPIFNLYIPSAFTPNNAGINDVFQAKGSYIKSFEMYIFDRWGMQLFHSTDINNGWNGTAKGGSSVVQEDTYIYQIYATDSRNKSHTYIGQVNLLK